jgi:hypothetical protein
MKRHLNDDRLLAIEVMNEPARGRMAQEVPCRLRSQSLRPLKSLKRTVPLTIGAARVQLAHQSPPQTLQEPFDEVCTIRA